MGTKSKQVIVSTGVLFDGLENDSTKIEELHAVLLSD